MTGLDKIIEKIKNQAAERAKEISGASLKKIDEMTAAAKAEGEEKYNAIIEEAHGKCASNLELAKSQAVTLINKKLLAGKVDIINETVELARAQLGALADSDFCELVLSIAGKTAGDGDGEMCFNENCLKKLPDDFEEQLKGVISDNRRICVCKEPCEIGDGFIIKYGLIEENCTFEAIIDANRQSIDDAISKILFA